jgi:hypothetical protein
MFREDGGVGTVSSSVRRIRSSLATLVGFGAATLTFAALRDAVFFRVTWIDAVFFRPG